ncbi:MAG: flagellar biosynthetic protein FliP, partial [Pseudomonadota bacterium]|nr:flagellar biosynthetic protein FliP [Pseudomonadota bacterium]
MRAATLKQLLPILMGLAGLLLPAFAMAQDATGATGIPGIPAFTVTPGEGEGAQEYSVTLQILALMTALTFLPAMLMMMTSFTRIIVVFAILRQAIGLQSTPSNQILLGLALFL